MKHLNITKATPNGTRVIKQQSPKFITAFVSAAVATCLNTSDVNATTIVHPLLSTQQMMDRIVLIEEAIIPDLVERLDPDTTDANGITCILNQVESDLTNVQQALLDKNDVDEVKKREFVRFIDLIEEELEMLKSQV